MIRIELLAFLNALNNEIDMVRVDPEESLLGDDPKVVQKFAIAIAAIERMYPMIQAIDEVMDGAISTALFWEKWKRVQQHLDFPDIEVEDIGDDVRGLLGKFGEGETA